MSVQSSRLRQLQIALSLPASVDRTYAAFALIAAMPVVILVASPARFWPSIAIALAYLAAALVIRRPATADRWMLAYVGLIGAFTLLSLARAELLDPLTNVQRAYAESKSIFFVASVLPFAIALALLLPSPASLRPAALVQLALGIGVAIVSVALQSDTVLGDERYQWQGNVIALAMMVAVQFWLIKRPWVVAVIGALGVAGILYAGSRQSVAIIGAGMVLTSAYWAGAAHWSSGVPWQKAVLSIRVVLPLVVLLAQAAAILGTRLVFGPLQHVGSAVTNPCHCVTYRIIDAATGGTGGHIDLAKAGLSLFLHHPIAGAGLGSFVGLVSGYQYPHNVFLEVGGELGLIGLLLIFVPLAFAWLRLVWQGMRTADPAIATLLALVVAYFVVANFSADIPSNRALWIFGIVALKFGLAGWRWRDRIFSTGRASAGLTEPEHAR